MIVSKDVIADLNGSLKRYSDDDDDRVIVVVYSVRPLFTKTPGKSFVHFSKDLVLGGFGRIIPNKHEIANIPCFNFDENDPLSNLLPLFYFLCLEKYHFSFIFFLFLNYFVCLRTDHLSLVFFFSF